MTVEPLEARIARAKAYPFPRHDHCFLFQDGAAIPLPLDGVCDTAGRVPVLAAGSNQSHEQLARKYAGREEFKGTVIPAWRGRLHDFDTVYAAKFTAYGSVPATFQHSPSTPQIQRAPAMLSLPRSSPASSTMTGVGLPATTSSSRQPPGH